MAAPQPLANVTAHVENLFATFPFVPKQPLLQPVWALILENGQPYVSHWLFAGWLTLVAYLLVCIYFTYKDLMRLDSKLQKDYWPTVHDMAVAAIPQILIYFFANLIFSVQYPIFQELPAQAPTVLQFLLECSCCFVIGDFLIYAEHRIMHIVPFLRNHIHNVHHSYHAPFSWAGGWVHPVEDLVVIFCQLFFPMGICHVHPFSFWCFTFFWTLCLIEEHSGHDVWWAPYNWMPFAKKPMGGGGAPHDIHHYWPNKNFGFVLICWDHLFGTYSPVVEPPKRPLYYSKWWEWSRNDQANTDANSSSGFY